MRYSIQQIDIVLLASLTIFTFQLSTFAQEEHVSQAQTGQVAQLSDFGTFPLEVVGVLEEGDRTLHNGSLYDIHEVKEKAGESITIHAASSDFNINLKITNSEGEQLAINEDIGSANPDSKVTIIFLDNDTYTILVYSSDVNGRGGYQLTITEATDSEIAAAKADRYFQQAFQQYLIGHFDQAIQLWEEAITLFQIADFHEGEANSLTGLGWLHIQLEEYQLSAQYFQKALDIYRGIGLLSSEASALNGLGMAYYFLESPDEGIEILKEALELSREIEDKDIEAKILGNLALAYRLSNLHEDAEDVHLQALEIFRELGDFQEELRVLYNLSALNIDLRRYDQSFLFLKEALEILDKTHDQAFKVSVLEQALMVSNEVEDAQFEEDVVKRLSTNYRDLAWIYLEEGLHQEALDKYQKALAFFRRSGGIPPEEGTFLANMGFIQDEFGQYAKALDSFHKVLTVCRQLEEWNCEGLILNHIALIYLDLGQKDKALQVLFEEALPIYVMVERDSQGRFVINTAFLRQTGEVRELESGITAVGVDFNSIYGLSTTLNNLGLVFLAKSEYSTALNMLYSSLNISSRYNESALDTTFINIGSAYLGLGDYSEALNYFQEGFSVAEKNGNLSRQSIVLYNISSIYLGQGDEQNALNTLEKSLELARQVGDRLGEVETLHQTAKILTDLGRYADAEEKLLNSLDIFERFLDNLADTSQISLFETRLANYRLLQNVLVAQGKVEKALEMSERGRARVFSSMLVNRSLNEHTHAPQNAFKLSDFPQITEIQQIARDTNSTLVTYSQIFDQALYIWVVQPSGEIAFRSVEFEGSGEGGLAANPIATLNDSLYRSTPDTSALTELVSDVRATLIPEASNAITTTERLKELHQVLIAPIADLLPTDPNAKVAFIPQGNLFLVPFAALQDAEGTHLIEKHTVLTAPSIQVYGLANEAASTTVGANGGSPFSADNALIVGNPTMPKVWSPTASGDFAETQLTELPGAKAEAEAIGGFLNITPLIGSQATEARVKQLLPSARLIHLATHGLLDYGDPRAYGTLDVPGAIALTPDSTEDGLLTSAEILEMDLQAELAVLSACDTGRGRITGDGVVGLSRALITAGVPSVVVSLWAVPDAPTAELMTEFYRQLDQGQDKAQALRQAMLTTLEQHPNPRNWAAFTLIGAAE